MKSAIPKTITDYRPPEWFKPDKNDLARHDDPEKIRQLGADMEVNGQLQPVGATEDGRLIWGHGRLLAAMLIMLKLLEVKLFPASLPATQFKLIRAAENLHRKELNGYQQFFLCAELLRDNPAWQMKDLAEAMHLDPSMISRLLSPAKCIEPVQIALRENKIGISHCYELSRESPQRQEELLRVLLAGGSRKAIKEARLRKGGNTEMQPVKPPPAKPARIPIRLPGGVSVVVMAGNELSLDNLVEISSEIQNSATIAREEGLSVQSWIAAMKDRAKAKDRKSPT